jgi:glycine cleavage system H protein
MLRNKVVEVNHALENEPGLVNQDPYCEGWMVVIKMTNPTEVDQLSSATEYQALVGGETTG